MTGTPLPTVVHAQTFTIPPSGQLLRFEVPIDIEDGTWVVLRLTDPTAAADERAPAAYRAYGNAIAYTSPFYLDPNGAPSLAEPGQPGRAPPGSVRTAARDGAAPRRSGRCRRGQCCGRAGQQRQQPEGR